RAEQLFAHGIGHRESCSFAGSPILPRRIDEARRVFEMIRRGHEGPPLDVGVLARLKDFCCVARFPRTKQDLAVAQWRRWSVHGRRLGVTTESYLGNICAPESGICGRTQLRDNGGRWLAGRARWWCLC